MDADAHTTLNNLLILAAVSQNDKLMTNGQLFDIYTPTSARGLMRMWYGEGRTHNVLRVRNVVHAAMAHSRRLLDEIQFVSSPTDSPTTKRTMQRHTLILYHLRMVDSLGKSTRGIENLMQTYKDDAALTSQLYLIIREVKDFLVVIRDLGGETVSYADVESQGLLDTDAQR